MVTKIVNTLGIALVMLLSVAPLFMKILENGFSLVVMDRDLILVTLLFLFACISGFITWRENRHISLASLTDSLPPKARGIIEPIRTGAISLVLTALFLSAFSQMFTAFLPTDKILGIPQTVLFGALPIAFLAMLISLYMKNAAKKTLLSVCIGGLIGLFIASGPISGVLYSATGHYIEFFGSVFSAWCAIASHATAPLVILMIVFAFLGVPLFIVLSGIAYIAFSQGGGYVEIISMEAYNIFTDKSIAAIPLFTITGYILSKGSAGTRLIEVFRALFGWFRGGTVVAAVIVATFFTTFTGVSGVTILALGSLLTIILTGSGYSEDDSHSLITASGALGLLFPPSIAIIMYGTTNYFSVDIFALFKGALIPGALLAIGVIAFGWVRDKRTHRTGFSPKRALSALKNSALEILLPIFICFGFFSGFFNLIESAAFSVVYAGCLETFIRRDFHIKTIATVIKDSIPVSGGVLFILAAARGLSYFLQDANIPAVLSAFVLDYVSSKYVFLMLLNLLLLLVGCLMDIYSAILIVSPLIIPIAESFGISPVHTGVIFLMNMQLGFLTPPVGMDLFIASYTFNVPVSKVIRGILPYLLVQFVVLMLVTYIPWFSNALL